MFFFFIYQIIHLQAGTIWPGSITNTIANINQLSDYTIVVIPETNVPPGGEIEITFPIQYDAFLGGQASCTNCKINRHSVTFYYTDQILAIANTLYIKNVKNPPQRGGTGNFIVRTKRYEFIYDENLIFQTIGIADQIQLLSSALVSSVTSPTSGSLTKYNFAFKTNTDLPFGTTIQLFIPPLYQFSNKPSCNLYPINGITVPGNIACLNLYNTTIQVSGFSGLIASGTEVGIQVSLTNPTYSLITQPFTIAAYRLGTSVIYTWRTQINSIQILPGLISSVIFNSVLPVKQATNKIMDYSLSFLPQNPLPSGAVILIKFPSTFQLVFGSSPINYDYVYLVKGLSDVSETSPVSLVFNATVLQISSFKATDPTQITINFRAQNPSNPGPTTPLTIRTYTDSTLNYIIDENAVDAITNIIKIPSLTPSQVTTSTGTSPQSQNQITRLIFSITPSVVIPANSYIQVLFDSSFTVGSVTNTNCLGAIVTASLACNKSDNLITWQNTAIQYNAAVQSQFGIYDLVYTPIYSGTYLIDINIYSPTNTILQSYSDYIVVIPYQMSFAKVDSLVTEVSSLTQDKFTILIFDFINQIVIPPGGYDPTNQQSYGRIEFVFLSGNWDPDLGTGLLDGNNISCKAIQGIQPISGRIYCNFYNTSSKTFPTIILRNFQEIEFGTEIIIHIPKIRIPVVAAGNIPIQVNLVQYNNRIKTVLNDYGTTGGQILLQTQYGNVPGYATATMTYSANLELSHLYNVSFPLQIGTDMLPYYSLLIKLPGYDTMFVPYEETLVCYLETYLNPCIQYPGVDWLLLNMQPAETHYFMNNPTLYLYNLLWPRYQNTIGRLTWIAIFQGKEMEIKTLGRSAANLTWIQPNVNNFDTSYILSPQKGRGYTGLTFEFFFKSSFMIPSGGQVRLTFPPDFQLDSSYPQAQFNAPQFSPISDTQPLTYTISANQLLITNLDEYPASGPFKILVSGIKSLVTPTDPASAYPFLISTEFQGKLITQSPILPQTTFDSFVYGQIFSPGMVIFNSISAFPNNQLEYATYTIDFTLTYQLLAGGQLKITFPQSHYPNLPTPGVNCICNITGGLTSFRSCTLQQYTYLIVTDQTYQSGMIRFQVNNILNPKAGITNTFTIQSYYDQNYLDISDDSLPLPRQLTIFQKSQPVLVQSIDFYPRNEGESATYVFTFVPSTYISEAYIVITFPDNYDLRLGDNLNCQLYGCTVQNRQLWVSGVINYQPLGTNPIIVQVTGIVNPNKNVNEQFTGYFKIGTILQNTNNYIDYNSQAGQVQIVPAPGWAYLYNVIPQNTYARWQSTNYYFYMNTLLPIPSTSSLGLIIVDFPKQFDIPDGTLSCVSSITNFTNLYCYALSNSIYINGQTSDYSGVVTFNITNLANPPDEGSINNIIIKTYDGFNKEIIEKSYINLDPWTFKYTYPGPLITINNDQLITVERGTQTVDLWFQVQYPCALNLTFTSYTQGLSIIPSTIKLKLTDLQQKFRISASEDLAVGQYSLTWKVEGEQNPPYYTPVKKSIVQVTNNKNIVINVDSFNEVPIGGTSLDTWISVDFAPNLGFEILLTSLSSVLYLSTRSLQFIAGQNNASFRVYCNQTEYNNQLQSVTQDTRSINLTLSGINQNVYILSQSLLDVTFISQVTQLPFITGILFDKTTQTTTNLILSAGEVCDMFYMIALQGTAQPSQSELVDQGPAPYPSTLSQYGKVSIGTSNTITIQLYGLQAQTPYKVFAIAQGRGGNYSVISDNSFTTQSRYNASLMKITFLQSYLNEAEVSSILSYIAFVLSLPTSKVVQQTTFTSQRMLQTSTVLSAYIISIPTTENFPSPLKLIDILNQRLTQLSSLVSNLDTTQVIKGQEYNTYYPQFINYPKTIKSTFTTCQIQGMLDRSGYIFAISVKASLDTSLPNALQVWYGYNSQNIPMSANYVQVVQSNINYNITISNLQQNTDYNIYVIPGSSHPGYPDIDTTSSSALKLVPCTTQTTQLVLKLDINYGILMGVIFFIF